MHSGLELATVLCDQDSLPGWSWRSKQFGYTAICGGLEVALWGTLGCCARCGGV